MIVYAGGMREFLQLGVGKTPKFGIKYCMQMSSALTTPLVNYNPNPGWGTCPI